jgi:hypothetical protein
MLSIMATTESKTQDDDSEDRGGARARTVIFGVLCGAMLAVYGVGAWRADRRLAQLAAAAAAAAETARQRTPEARAEAAEDEAIARAREATP